MSRSAESTTHDTQAIYAAAYQKGRRKRAVRQGMRCFVCIAFSCLCMYSDVFIVNSTPNLDILFLQGFSLL